MDLDYGLAIVGGGIGGLALALELHKRSLPFRVFEAAPEYKPLGVGLNLLPHAMKSLSNLGLLDALMAKGVETKEYHFYTKNGQLVDVDPRGKAAGYDVPQCSIHRGDLHQVLVDAVVARCGKDAIVMNHKATGVSQSADTGTVHFIDAVSGAELPDARAAVVVACDGVHSVIRSQFHPHEAVPRYEGTMNYRGVTRWKPFLSGATMIYMGTTETGKLILYPIRDNIDGKGNQLINWVIELEKPNVHLVRDWNRPSDPKDFIGNFEQCSFDFLDIPAVLKAADHMFEYPMCDQEMLPFWTEGRVTLLGDAAHPMMPRGSNGAAQAIIDAEVLADLLAENDDWPAALKAYDDARRETVNNVVMANRSMAPDAILRVVEERTGGKPFDDINSVIPKEERTAWQSRYKSTVGFSPEQMAKTGRG
jgi:5-methylphenazine-1-carboxylate 1-monooxygenase